LVENASPEEFEDLNLKCPDVSTPLDKLETPVDIQSLMICTGKPKNG